jgi:hypothetical protein
MANCSNSGIEVAQSTVAKYMASKWVMMAADLEDPFQHHAPGIGAMDFLIVPRPGMRRD